LTQERRVRRDHSSLAPVPHGPGREATVSGDID